MNSLKIETRIMKNIQIRIIFFLVGWFVCANVQNLKAQTKVIIEFGADAKTTQLFAEKTQVLLNAVNTLQNTGVDEFPSESGVKQLKAIVKEKNLVSSFDTLGTKLIRFGKTRELRRIFLKVKGGKAYDYEEIVLEFDESAHLTNARLALKQHDFDRILSRQVAVSSSEQQKLETFLASYQLAFESKDAALTQALFKNDAQIIVGSRAKSFKGFEFNRYELDSYLKRIIDRTFVKGNEIKVLFDETQFLQHPDMDGVYGVIARQQWQTTAYSDVGYIFFIVDTRDSKNPIILARQWQEDPYVVSKYSSVAPDPLQTTAIVTRYEKLPKSKKGEGKLTIDIKSADPDLLNANLVKTWFDQGKMSFSSDSILVSGLKVLSPNQLEANFALKSNKWYAKTNLQMRESALLKGFSTNLMVYSNNKTVLSLIVLQKDSTRLPQAAKPLWSNLTLNSMLDSVQVQVQIADTKQTVFDSILLMNKPITLNLIEMDFVVNYSKKGYVSQTKQLSLKRSTTQTDSLALQPEEIVVAEPPVVAKAPKSYAKYWIIGGAAVLVGGAAVLLSGSDGKPGIPVPPGRPGVN